MAFSWKKQKFLSFKEKAQIIADVERGRKMEGIVDDFGIPCSLLSTILKSKVSIARAISSGVSKQWKKLTTTHGSSTMDD